MNPKADNIQLVIASIEAEPELFDMTDWETETSCGTARCIGGWAEFHIKPDQYVSPKQVGEWMGLPYADSMDLFFVSDTESEIDLDDITKDMAIAALRDLQKDPVFKGWDHYVREDA